jgi:hypothetical protein
MSNYVNLAIASALLIGGVTLNANAQDVAPPPVPASTCFHEPPISIPENKLLHFDSSIRIPGSYLVRFKCDGALALVKVNSTAHRSQVLPDMFPASSTNCTALASAYAKRFGGRVSGVWCSGGFLRGFGITGISEAAIVVLAQDDRIEYVEPNMVATAQ